MIFNVLVDAVIHHWVTLSEAKEAGAEGLGVLV